MPTDRVERAKRNDQRVAKIIKALPDPQRQRVISDLRYVVDRLAEFYSPDETRLWLYSKHRLLNSERAFDLTNQGDAEKVLAVIESLDEANCT